MTKKEELEQFAYENEISINEVYFQNENFEGLYIDNNVFINEEIKPYKYNVILAHELGHHETLKGNALQEMRANGWAYKKILPIEKLIEYKLCNVEYEDIIEELCISSEDFCKIMDYYKSKYAPHSIINGYKIRFDPSFSVECI